MRHSSGAMIRIINNEPSGSSPTWWERIAALHYVPALIKLVWQTHRGLATAVIALRLSLAFTPVATLWVGKLIIDAVVDVMRNPPADFMRLWKWGALEAAIVLAGEAVSRASRLVESLLGDLFTN